MTAVLRGLGWLALLATVLPSLLYLTGHLEHDVLQTVMLVAAIVWFLTAPWRTARRGESSASS